YGGLVWRGGRVGFSIRGGHSLFFRFFPPMPFDYDRGKKTGGAPGGGLFYLGGGAHDTQAFPADTLGGSDEGQKHCDCSVVALYGPGSGCLMGRRRAWTAARSDVLHSD